MLETISWAIAKKERRARAFLPCSVWAENRRGDACAAAAAAAALVCWQDVTTRDDNDGCIVLLRARECNRINPLCSFARPRIFHQTRSARARSSGNPAE